MKKVFEFDSSLVECFLAPPDFVIQAAFDIRSALEAYCDGDLDKAKKLLCKADNSKINEYQAEANDIKVKRAKYFNSKVNVEKTVSTGPRMPGISKSEEVFKRDLWHCRFCSSPIIDKRVVHFLKNSEIGLRWGRKNKEKHDGVKPLFAVADHILPYSRGGKTENSNLVAACGVCNYSRGNYTLDRVGLLNPFERKPKVTIPEWDGLMGLLKSAKIISKRK